MNRATRPLRARLGAALSVAVLIAIVTGASAAGPGGWDHLGTGSTSGTSSLNGAVYALNGDRSTFLYAGGTFTTAGGVAGADRIASWNGFGWAAVSSPTSRIANGAVNAIAFDQGTGRVFAGGTFTVAGGSPANFLAVWDGTSWAPFCASIPATVNALEIIGRNMYVGGSFGAVPGVPFSDRLLRCDLDTGAASATAADAAHAFSGGIYALTADSNGTLYAGGGFTDLGGDPAGDNVAYMDGSGWHAMGSGGGGCSCAVSSFVRSLTAIGTDVYIGTDAKDVAGIAQADNVARWNGMAWSAVGSNTAGTDGWFPASAFIYGMANDGKNVYATGSFQNANGDPTADAVASFDGTAWHPLGSDGAGNGPWTGNGLALAVWGQHLYAGGSFTSAGGDPQASYIAQYAPQLAPPPPPPPPVVLPNPPTVTITSPAANAFVNHPEELLVSGTVTAPGGLARFCVAANTPAMPSAAQCDETSQVGPSGSFTDVSVSANVVPGLNTITAYALDKSGQVRDATVSVELPSGVDLRATSIEVTQGTQRFGLPLNFGLPVAYSGVTLVQGATTVVRAYANAFATGRAAGLPIPNVPALLEGTRNGSPLPDSPLSPDSGPASLFAGPLVVDLREIADPNSGYTFTLPLSWTEGGPIQLRSEVNPQTDASSVPELNTSNNQFTLTGVSFHHHNPLVISPVRITYTDPVTHKFVQPLSPSFVFERASMVTPLADGDLIIIPYLGTIDLTSMYKETEGTPTEADDRNSATFTAVATWEDNNNADGLTIGVIADPNSRGYEFPVAFGGCIFCSHPSVVRTEPIAYVNATRPLTSVTHELWHTQNYYHAGTQCNSSPHVDWPPDNRGYTQGMGLDRRPDSGGRPGTYRRLIAGSLGNPPLENQKPQYYDVMSYCNFGIEDITWNSPRTWDGWGNVFPIGLFTPSRDAFAAPAAAPVHGRTVRVMAFVNPDGTGQITQVRPEVTGTAPTPDDTASPYGIVARDAAGAVISSTGAKPELTHVDYQVGQNGEGISVVVAADGAHSIELTSHGKVIATRTRAPRPPTVTLLSPKPGTRIGSTGNVAVRWRAADSNGAPLEVTVLYSADGGRTYRNLALGGFTGATTVPAALFGKTTNGRIRVAVNDGFDEVSAISGRLSSTGAPPVVQILKPITGERVRADAILALFGAAFDDSGRLITAPDRLTWFDGRQRVGRGRSETLTGLAPGGHRLTLRARGANGLVGLTSVTVKVLGVKPDLMITAPHSIRRTAHKVTLRVASTVPGVLRAGGRSFRVTRKPRSITIPIKPGRRPLIMRLVVRGGGGQGTYTVKLKRT